MRVIGFGVLVEATRLACRRGAVNMKSAVLDCVCLRSTRYMFGCKRRWYIQKRARKPAYWCRETTTPIQTGGGASPLHMCPVLHHAVLDALPRLIAAAFSRPATSPTTEYLLFNSLFCLFLTLALYSKTSVGARGHTTGRILRRLETEQKIWYVHTRESTINCPPRGLASR